MPLWIWAALAWVAYRKYRGQTLLPGAVEKAFLGGAMLVKTETGHLVAVPLETPMKDPLRAAADGDLHPDAAMAVFETTGTHPDQVLMGGFGDPWNEQAGVGQDYEPGIYGLLRSTSISARRRV